MKVYTIGHSNRSIQEFLELLTLNNIDQLVDVRTIAKSRHNPQFGESEIRQGLSAAGVEYVRLEKLGGLRPTKSDSVNKGWNNKSFRGYADHMQTEEFEAGLKQLIDLAAAKPTAIMCAEAVPWRCHRSLIGDALLVRDIEVIDIISKNNLRPHKLTSFARVNGKTITYPAE